MANVKQTIANFMATFFGKSEKAISEKLTSEEHNQFTTEALELQEKITGLQNQVTALESEKTTLATEKATLESDKTTLQNSLTQAQKERDTYKAWFDKQKGAGTQLPEADATSKAETEMADYNADALAMFRKKQA
jgi:chromosome segregation ATPase